MKLCIKIKQFQTMKFIQRLLVKQTCIYNIIFLCWINEEYCLIQEKYLILINVIFVWIIKVRIESWFDSLLIELICTTFLLFSPPSGIEAYSLMVTLEALSWLALDFVREPTGISISWVNPSENNGESFIFLFMQIVYLWLSF